ncbi:MAG: helix-turn-helix transcriptional regulator [Treponema sp.]|jgi:AraC-like DNA-binding protein|nr:helix-turn-helix transcriptional regulator [Treponema sp.]
MNIDGLKKNPVSRRWLASYLIILIVPLILSVGIYFLSQGIIFRASEEIYAATLEQVKVEVDSQLMLLRQVIDHIMVSDNVRKLRFIQAALEPNDYFNIYKLVVELRNYQAINTMLDDTLVILNRNGTVAGRYGHMSLSMYFEIFLSESDLSLEEFTHLVRGKDKAMFFKTKDQIFFLQTIPFSDTGAGPVTAVLVIRDSSLADRFLKNFAANGSVLSIIGGNGQIIASTAGKEIDGARYRSLKNRSGLADWEFQYLIPVDLQNRKARQIQFFTLGGFLFCSVFGVFFSVRMTRRNYGEYHGLELSLEDNLRILRKYYLYTLLEKPFDPVKDGEDMKLYGIQLSGGNFLVIFFNSGESRQGEARFFFMKIFQEAVDRRISVEMTDAGRNIAAIVNWQGSPEDSETVIGRLEDDIEAAQRKTRERFGFPVSAALSDPHRGIEGIYYANLEAREAFQYLDSAQGEVILRYKDIRYSGGSYRYPLEIEQKIINFIRLGDHEKAGNLLRRVFTDNASRTGFSARTAKMLASDLMGTLMKGGLPPGTKFPVELPAGVLVPEHLIDYIEKALKEICRANRSFLEEKHSRQLGEKVKAYIDENFRNPDLNISITALHFDLTPAYLSGIFQQDTGLNLLEYINTRRIEESKKLLEQGRSINKTAELSGFRGSSTFIRIFRKITGITPGQYKDIN